MKIYMNGKLVDKAKAHVSVFDHGLLYGDGVFEGIRAYNGRVFMLDEHVDRLYRSAQAISLSIPMTKKEMARAVIIACKANKARFFGGNRQLRVGAGTAVEHSKPVAHQHARQRSAQRNIACKG